MLARSRWLAGRDSLELARARTLCQPSGCGRRGIPKPAHSPVSGKITCLKKNINANRLEPHSRVGSHCKDSALPIRHQKALKNDLSQTADSGPHSPRAPSDSGAEPSTPLPPDGSGEGPGSPSRRFCWKTRPTKTAALKFWALNFETPLQRRA